MKKKGTPLKFNFSNDEDEDNYFDDIDDAVLDDSDDNGGTIEDRPFSAAALKDKKKGKANNGTQKNQLLQE